MDTTILYDDRGPDDATEVNISTNFTSRYVDNVILTSFPPVSKAPEGPVYKMDVIAHLINISTLP